MQDKATSNIAAKYRKTKPLSVKQTPSSSEEDTNCEEDNNSEAKSPEKDGGQASVKPPAPPAAGQLNSQLGFGFGVPIEEELPSKP